MTVQETTQMDAQQVEQVIEFTRCRLSELCRERNIPLELEERDYKVEDEWLTLIVTPTQPGVRASDYCDLMEEIEREMREQGWDNVLILPAVPD